VERPSLKSHKLTLKSLRVRVFIALRVNPLKSCLEIPFFSPGGPATHELEGFKEIPSRAGSNEVALIRP